MPVRSDAKILAWIAIVAGLWAKIAISVFLAGCWRGRRGGATGIIQSISAIVSKYSGEPGVYVFK